MIFVFVVLIIFNLVYSLTYIIEYNTTNYFLPNNANCSVIYIPYPILNYSVLNGTNCVNTLVLRNQYQNNVSSSFITPDVVYIVTPSFISEFPNNETVKITSVNITYTSPIPSSATVLVNTGTKLAEFRRYWYVGYEQYIFYEPIPILVNYIFTRNNNNQPVRLFGFSYVIPYNITFYKIHISLPSWAAIPENITCSGSTRISYMVRTEGNIIINHTTTLLQLILPNYTYNFSVSCPTARELNTSFSLLSADMYVDSVGFFNNAFAISTGALNAVYAIAFNQAYTNFSMHKSDPITPIVFFKSIHNWNNSLYRYWIVEDPGGRCWFGEYVPSSNQIIATMPVQCNTNTSQGSNVQFYNYTVNYNNTCKFNYNNTHVTINYTHTLSSPVRVVKINKSGTIVTNVTLNNNAQLVFNRETDFVVGVYTNDFKNVICYYREQYTTMNNNVQRFFHLLFILLASAVPLSVLFTIPAYAVGVFSNIPIFTIIHSLALSSLIYFFTRGQFHMFTLPIFLIITSVLVNYNIVLPSPPSSWGVVETLFALPVTLINFIIELFRLPYSLVMHIFNSLPPEFSAFEWLAQTVGLAINTYFILYAFTIIYNRFQR